jgi:transglutaminase-like putative cysteine protease
MGEVITLKGHHFGKTKDESYVSIAGIVPTNSSYFTWQEDKIMVRVPESGESGLVYVHVKGRKSNGVLFSNTAAVPRPIEGEEIGTEPRIAVVSPQTGTPGTLITISGSNFGAARENTTMNGGVFFSWDYDAPPNPFAIKEQEFIEVSETELGYEVWGTREIRVRLPDGAVSGNLEIRTPNGNSRPVLFDVSGKPGTKSLKDKRRYTVNYSVDVKVTDASRPNTLYLWVPVPVTSPSQRNIALVSRSANPYVENHRGVSLFKLDNLTTGSSHKINVSYNVEVYAVETAIRPVYIRQEDTPLHNMYTHSSALIPSDNSQIKSTAGSITGREQNPYIKARLIYDWIIKNIQITETVPPLINSIHAVLEHKQADSYYAAFLFVAMARASNLPCIPVSGVLVNIHNQTLRHYWAEFWIDGFGWLPVDPVMGAEAVPDAFIIKQDNASYFFGNSDNQRVAFSRGEINLSQVESKGRLVSHNQSYSLQNIWEEAVGGLESYSSTWGEVVISGIYVH